MKVKIIHIAALALCLAGCATGPTLEQQMTNSGKSFEDLYPVSPAYANVFFCRSPQWFEMKVTVDGFPIEIPLEGGSFLPIQMLPGSHQIILQDCQGGAYHSIHEEVQEMAGSYIVHANKSVECRIGMDNLGDDHIKTTSISLEAGRNYFYKTGIGFITPKDLKELTEEDRQKMVLGSQSGNRTFIVMKGDTFYEAWSKLRVGMKSPEVDALLHISQPNWSEDNSTVHEHYLNHELHYFNGSLQSWN